MEHFIVPWHVANAPEPGVFLGAGIESIDDWITRYLTSGTALREWVALWAVAQQALVTWAEAQEAQRHDDPGP